MAILQETVTFIKRKVIHWMVVGRIYVHAHIVFGFQRSLYLISARETLIIQYIKKDLRKTAKVLDVTYKMCSIDV